MGAGVRQQHCGMATLFLIDNAQIVTRTDGAQTAQFPGEAVVFQGWMKRLVHKQCQRHFHPPLIPLGESGKGPVEAVRCPQRHGLA